MFLAVFAVMMFSCGNTSPETKWTVKFDSDGGSEIPSQSINDGARIQKPDDPEREGYSFKNWTCFEEQWSFVNNAVTEDITLKATWTPNRYSITVGNQVICSVIFDGNYNLTPPKKEGYTFDCYTLNGNAFPMSGLYTIPNNIILEEKWIINEYTATFVAFGKEVGKTTFTINDKTLKSIPSVKQNGLEVAWNYTLELRDITVSSNTVYLGKYDQNTHKAGVEPIEWYILENRDGNTLLLSRYGLDNVKYNESWEPTTWETTQVRGWLNGSFYNEAFTADEKKNIILSKVSADNNPAIDSNPGNDTNDYVFLLSVPEVDKYLKNDPRKNCVVTEFAASKGAHSTSGSKYGWWLTRTPGKDQRYVVAVFDSGEFYNLNEVSCQFNVLRPAVWVKTNTVE